MSVRLTRGACPALAAPLQTGDGLLVRLSPACGALTPAQLEGLAEAGLRHGNGILEVTARGSLQLRGLKTDTVAPLAADIDALGIAVRTGVPVETGPLAGLDPQEVADPRPLADAIRGAIARIGLAQSLGPKVSVVVDGGGALHLAGLIADVRLTAARVSHGIAWRLAVAGTAETAVPIATVDEQNAHEAAIFVLTKIAELGRQSRGADLDPAAVGARIAHLAGAFALIVDGDERPPKNCDPVGVLNLADGRAALGVGLPFGQIEASRLAGFCRMAGDADVSEIRPSPGRALLLLAEASACLEIQPKVPRYGLIADPGDARLGIAACPGSPACASGHIAARAIAEQLAALGHGLFDNSLAVHVSGCPKGCARPAPADLTFVGHEEGVDLIVAGTASGMADVRLDHAEIRHGFARLAGLYREKRRPGESANSCLSRLGASRVAAAFQGQS